MWTFEHLAFLTLLSAAAVVTIACGGFYLSAGTFPAHRVAGQVLTVTVTLAMSIILSVGLNQAWRAKRDNDRRMWTARAQHQERLRVLLRAEAESLSGLAQALREGRYFTLVADDARKAVWQDDTLTTDVERHFPEYFHDRERLIREILEYDSELGRIRHSISAALHLTDGSEPYRSDLVPALVNKCGGAASRVSLVRLANDSAARPSDHRVSGSERADQFEAMRDAARTYEQYQCPADLTRRCHSLLDHAADLADAAARASEAARRYAEETVLQGSCTYAPAE